MNWKASLCSCVVQEFHIHTPYTILGSSSFGPCSPVIIVTLSLRVILVGLFWSLKLVVGWNLKERRIGPGAGQVLGFSCGFAAARIGGFVEDFNSQFG